MNRTTTRRLRLVTIVSMVVGFAQPLAWAAPLTWDNAGATNDWNTTDLNWADGVNPLAAWVNGSDAIFGATPEAVTVTSAVGINDMSFGGNWTIAGGAGSLSTFDSNSNITVDPTFTAVLTASLGGSGSITKLGTGSLTLNAPNTFSGGLIVNAGKVTIDGSQVNNRLANNSSVTINNGGTVDIVNTNPIPTAGNAVNFTIEQGGTLTSTAGNHIHIGNVTLNGGTWTHTGATNYNSERFQLNGNVTVGGTAVSTISGSQGIGLLNDRTFTVADVTNSAATDLNITGELENNDSGAADGIIKAGPGTMQLSTLNSYTGATVINAGTLLVTGGQALGGTSGITVNSGATLRLNGTNTIVNGHGTAVANGKVITVNGGTLLMDTGMDARFGNVTLNEATWTSNRVLTNYDALLANTTTGAATVLVTGSTASVMNGTGGIHLQGVQNFNVNDVTSSNAVDLTVSMILSGPGTTGGAAGGINKQGAGKMALSAANNYNGETRITDGVLALTGTGTLGTGNVIVNGTLDVTGLTAVSFGISAGLSGDGIIDATGKTLNINGAFGPGNSAGSLDVLGDAVLGGSSVSTFEITGPGVNDLLAVTNALTYGGTLGIVTTESTGSFDLFNFASFSGDFSAISLTGTGFTGNLTSQGGGLWSGTNGLTTASFDGGSGVLSFTAIPEPNTYFALAAGASILALLRRRRVQRAA